MKKSFVVIGILLASLCAILGLAACDEEHEHVWGEWQQLKAATCTEEGSQHRFCTKCNEEQILPIEMLPHTYTADWQEVTPATCTAGGVEKNVCDVCGNEQTRATAMIAHTPVPVEKLEATCLLPGHEAGTECSACSTKLSGLETIPAPGHDFGDTWEQIKEPTCIDEGLEQHTCRRAECGEVESRVLKTVPHHIIPLGVDKAPTCTDGGTEAGEECDVCRRVLKEIKILDPLGHQMENPEHYEKDGVNYHKGSCSRCSDSVVDEQCDFTVVKTAATCTKAEHHVHTCPTCHFEYEHDEGSPLGHNFGEWHFDVKTYDASLRDRDGAETVIRQHIRTCSNAGHEVDPDYPEVEACTEVQDGDPVLPTCIKSGYTNFKCEDCENRYTGDRVNALGHEWLKNEDGSILYTHMQSGGIDAHYRTCTRENCDNKDKGGRDVLYGCYYGAGVWQKATCEKGLTLIKTCEVCKNVVEEERGQPLGHAYGAWTHDDATLGAGSMHYRICGREECGNKDEQPCTMQSSNIAATCQKPGKEIQICRDCKYNEEGEEIAMLDHDVTGQPYITERSQQRHYQECKRCSTRVYEACPYSTSVETMTCTTDEKTTYTCPICQDTYTRTTATTKGHTVTHYTESDKFYHRGNCDECKELVSVAHDFSDSNICKVCAVDGLSYAFEAGSNNTRAKVVRTVKDGAYYYINTAKLVIPDMVNIDGNGNVPVVGISTDAFYGNRNIREVELPLTLEYIGYNAFNGCTSLETVYFHGHAAEEADVSDCKLNRIEDGAFDGCVKLTNAILPETLQYIGRRAFRGCSELADITIPAQVTEIEDHAFTDTKFFLTEDNWDENGVLYIGPHLIRAKTSVEDITVEEGIVSISAEAFMDCKFLTRIELPSTLKAVDRDAFKGCDALTTVVFNGTFEQYIAIRFDNNEASPMHIATELTIAGDSGTLVIPEETTVIPAGAFRGSNIESIVIPANVTSIGANAFADCEHLADIKFAQGSKIISIGADVVANTPYYATDGNWDNGVLYIKDENETPVALVAVDKDRVQTAYEKYQDETFEGSAKQVVIGSGTRVVAPEAFKDFTELRYVEMPDTVVFLGEGVFSGCSGLKRVNFRGNDGRAWFCYSAQIGRVYTDAAVYGGDAGTDYAKQRDAADLFNTYPLQWKRGNYGSGS